MWNPPSPITQMESDGKLVPSQTYDWKWNPIRMDGEYLVGDISDLFEDTVRSTVDKSPEAGMQVLFQGCSSHVLQILQVSLQGEDREYG